MRELAWPRRRHGGDIRAPFARSFPPPNLPHRIRDMATVDETPVIAEPTAVEEAPAAEAPAPTSADAAAPAPEPLAATGSTEVPVAEAGTC